MIGIIGSTGRTATTFLADVYNQLENTVASHEGYEGSEKQQNPILPLINLENLTAYQHRDKAIAIAKEKRSSKIFDMTRREFNARHIIDVAYYNAIFASAILQINPSAKFAGIIRDCENFVRSSTTIEGEDLLPVGWPPAEKPLTQREKFISFGRIRPARDSEDGESWKKWSAIEKNIWLWKESNIRILETTEKYPERAKIYDFSDIKLDGEQNLLSKIAQHFGLPIEQLPNAIKNAKSASENKKQQGYQIGSSDAWSKSEQLALKRASEFIRAKFNHVKN